MDAAYLASLLRSLATTPSRRGVARALAGSALAGLLIPSFGLTEADAKTNKKKRRKKKKRKKKQCAEGQIRVGDKCVTGAGTCGPAHFICVDTCNDSPQCVCHLTYEGIINGTLEVRCGDNSIQSLCGECTTDAECASYGPGAYCAIENNPFGSCGGCESSQGFCRTPCPN